MTGPVIADSIAAQARRYVEQYGLALVDIEPGEKGPKGRKWNQPGGYFTDPAAAEANWQRNADHNLGVVLGPSGVCSLDVDDVQWTRQVLYDLHGLDLDALALVYPTSVGNPARFRIMFRVPAGVELKLHALVWPNEHDPDGSKLREVNVRIKAAVEAEDVDLEQQLRAEAAALKRLTVFELRAGLVQDVLPPSIHPGTGKPYTWRTPLPAGEIPVLPAELLAIWTNWEIFKRDGEGACPWAPKAKAPVKPKAKPRASTAAGSTGSVIEQFNRAHDIESLLQAHGYIQRGKKWLCPHSSTGLPGVTISRDGPEVRVYSHHASDPLSNGHQNDAFDVYCLLEHGGNQSEAVKAAARLLGIERPTRADTVRHGLSPEEFEQQAASPAEDLPLAPSEDEAALASAAATAEGEGEVQLARVLERFLLVGGDTKVFDRRKRIIMKKAAFEALVTKPVAKAWFDDAGKKVIAADQAKRWVEQAALGGRGVKVGENGMAPVERFVLIEGTRDIWDVERRRRIPAEALRLQLGDQFNLWLNSGERRSVDMDHLVFDPTMTKDPAVYINTFEGLPLTADDDASKCAAILDVVRFLCNGDEEVVHYLLCWLALPLQKVGTKLATAVLMHSTMEGSGKSLLLSDIMRVIYGQYGATVGQAQMDSSWSSWQSNKLYGVFEEVVSRDQRYNQVGKIKHMITGKTFRIEAKFMNGWEESNYMNALFLSNEIIPWPISQDDRRLLVIWPEETMDEAMRVRVERAMNSGGIEAFYGFLLSYDVGDFHAHKRPPRTAARQRLVELSMASWQTFLSEWRLNLLGVPFETCVSSDLYALFLEWCKRGGEHTLSQTKFSGFIGSQVLKEKGIPWADGMRRAFASFFFPSPPPSTSAAELGRAVEKWRAAARKAGWDVDGWEHMKRRAAPAVAT